MSISDLKKKLHNYIEQIEDKTQLQLLNEAAQAYATQQPDIIDLLTPEQLKHLEASIKQADEGKVIPHDEVIKLSKQWLSK